MLKKLIFVSLFILTILACSLSDKAGEVGNIDSVSSSDAEMNAAIQQAQATLPLFIREFQNPKPSQIYFGIKVQIPYGDGNSTEHLWVSQLSYSNNRFTGILGNEPYYIKDLHLGDTITVELKDISDWMIIANNKLYGGFTLHVLSKDMTEKEISEFEAENGFTIGDEPILP
jgi:uncharacterized protein YegJ (DUF2314 family)